MDNARRKAIIDMKYKLITLAAFFLTIIIPIFCYSQNPIDSLSPETKQLFIRGRVIDANTKTGHPYAVVWLFVDGQRSLGANTDSTGNYQISNFEPRYYTKATYELQAVSIGYLSDTIRSIDIQDIRSGKKYDFLLLPDPRVYPEDWQPARPVRKVMPKKE